MANTRIFPAASSFRANCPKGVEEMVSLPNFTPDKGTQAFFLIILINSNQS